MKSRLKNYKLSFILLCFGLWACEDEFAGRREENSSLVNGPFSMKIVSLAGTEYLAVLNTNFRFQTRNGSIQFYNIAAQPSLQTSPAPLSIPSNTSDFCILNDKLYLLNRIKRELWVYELSNGNFTLSLDSTGAQKVLKLASNPLQIFSYTRTARSDLGFDTDSRALLAIVSQTSGTLSLVDPSDLSYVNPAEAVSGTINATQLGRSGIYGTTFYMTARQTQVVGKDDKIGVSAFKREGDGLTGFVFYGGRDDMAVGFNAFGLAVFGYRLGSFQNTSNFTWYLPGYERSRTLEGGIRRRGTKERGFRGIDKDDAGNIFLSSRSDNSIYILSSSDINLAKDGARNTTGFSEDVRSKRLEFDFGGETDLSDKIFTRLGHLVVQKADYRNPNTNNDGVAATDLWVIALGEDKVYRLSLSNTGDSWSVSSSTSRTVGCLPQRLLRYSGASGDFLYVANTKGDSIQILNPSTLDQEGIINGP